MAALDIPPEGLESLTTATNYHYQESIRQLNIARLVAPGIAEEPAIRHGSLLVDGRWFPFKATRPVGAMTLN